MANESSESEVEDVRMLENISESAPFLQPFPVWILAGTQYVSKFKEEARNRVRLFLAVIRLEEVCSFVSLSVYLSFSFFSFFPISLPSVCVCGGGGVHLNSASRPSFVKPIGAKNT